MARGRAANGSGMQPRKRKDGLWEVRFATGIDPGTGKTIMKSLYGKTSEEVAEKLRLHTSEIDQGDYVEPSKMTISQWMDIWLQDYCGHVAKGTLVLYKSYVKNHIKPKIGALQLSKLNPHDVQHFVNGLKYQNKRGVKKKTDDSKKSQDSKKKKTAPQDPQDTTEKKPMAYKTRKNIHGCLSAALDKALELKYIKSNPATGCNIPRNPDEETSSEGEVNPFSTEELSRFLDAAKDSDYKDIYTMALNTGMRLSEILGLRWSRYNQSKSVIKIDCQLAIAREKGERRVLTPTKNHKSRSFKIAPSVVSLLRSLKVKQAENRLKAGSAWKYEIDDLIFTNEIGGTIPHSTIEKDFARVCANAEVTGHRFHDLRHTFATLAIQHGADIKTLSKALGHYSVAFTLDLYCHVSEEMSNNFASLMESIITAR